MSSSIQHSIQHSATVTVAHVFGPDGPAARRAADELQRARRKREECIDSELAQSFPASDPPSWVQGIALRT